MQTATIWGCFKSSWVSSCFQSIPACWSINILANNFSFAGIVTGGKGPTSSLCLFHYVINTYAGRLGPELYGDSVWTSHFCTMLRPSRGHRHTEESKIKSLILWEILLREQWQAKKSGMSWLKSQERFQWLIVQISSPIQPSQLNCLSSLYKYHSISNTVSPEGLNEVALENAGHWLSGMSDFSCTLLFWETLMNIWWRAGWLSHSAQLKFGSKILRGGLFFFQYLN